MVKKLDHVPTIIAGDLTKLKEILHPKNDEVDLPYSLAFATLEVGESSLKHQLSSTEVYHIIKGEGKAIVGEEQWDISSGDTFLVLPNTDQLVKNTGQTRLDFICMVSPPWEPAGETIL